MDKPRHPQVIRPWKIQPAQKTGMQKSAKLDQRNLHEANRVARSFVVAEV
jgi:hypothetical protein